MDSIKAVLSGKIQQYDPGPKANVQCTSDWDYIGCDV